MRRMMIMVGILCLVAVCAWAQTPLDPVFQSTRTSVLLWAGTIVAVGGIGLGILIWTAVHHPQVLLYVVFGFVGLFLIGYAASGALGAWVGLP